MMGSYLKKMIKSIVVIMSLTIFSACSSNTNNISSELPIIGIVLVDDEETQYVDIDTLIENGNKLKGELIFYSDNTVSIDAELISKKGKMIDSAHVEKAEYVLDKDNDLNIGLEPDDENEEKEQIIAFYNVEKAGVNHGTLVKMFDSYIFFWGGDFGVIFGNHDAYFGEENS